MIDLYIDFDGVILNTVDVIYNQIHEEFGNVILEDFDVTGYVSKMDWDNLIANSFPINDSINKIKKIIKSNLYDVKILTHVSSSSEVKAKELFLSRHFDNIDMIPVVLPMKKSCAVSAKGSILVDDFSGNIEDWENNGGLGIKFSCNRKKYSYMKISDLEELIDKYEEIRDNLLIKSCQK